MTCNSGRRRSAGRGILGRVALGTMTSFLLVVVALANLALFVVAAEEPATTSLLRGSESGASGNDRNMEVLRRLLQWSPDDAADAANRNHNDNYSSVYGDRNRTSTWTHWHTAWSMLGDDDLAAMAYDTSPLNREAHQAWGAAYVTGRRTRATKGRIERRLGPKRGPIEEEVADTIDERSNSGTAFLRGNVGSYNERADAEEDSRNLQWTQHTGNDNDPSPDFSFMNIEPQSASAEGETEAERQGWEERLANAVETTQMLNERHGRYDTNEVYSYSDPTGINNDSNGQSETEEMQQFSHTATTTRQRLLTGSYAAWQWYDRSNLASPANLNLQKVSRINYAFFQTDAEGYIFGTDSWADPNVLFGPYDFATTSERLPEACRGGKGRPSKDSATLDHDHEEDAGATAGGTADAATRRRRHRRAQTTQTTDGEDATPGNTGTTCEHFEQCHRNFPNSKSCNIHKYKEGLIYRAHASGAQIYPSIGGWTLSGSFPTVAASSNGRKRFARECVGLLADYGFDGIDIDWEYPGYAPHGGSPRDRDNFNQLLLEVREALNEYQIRTGDAPLGGGAFGLTAALPCGPANIDFLDVPFVSQVLDGMNLMTFDFHNEMERVTGVNSPLFDQEWDEEPGLSVDGCVKNYYEGGAGDHAAKISIGIPFYGKTFAFATELGGCHSNTACRGGGTVDQDNWPQDLGTPVYYNILDRLGRGGMVSRRHEPTKTQYATFADGSGLVTYDDPQAVCDKVEYVNLNLLGGVFVWEMSGDLLSNLETPLLDAINRKLEETNFDCRGIASPEDGQVVELPPKAPKGPAQVERRDDENVVTSIIEHLNLAEDGELVSGGGGAGAFTRVAFMSRTFDGRLFPSYVYRYEHFLDALQTMSTVGVDGNTFYLGYGQEEAMRRRQLQASSFGGPDEFALGPTDVSERSLVYGLVNIAAYLAQAMTDAIIHDACDELNTDYLPDDDTDGIGLDDGKDVHRFPISNSCGQNGRSYQTEHCSPEDSQYDCVTQMNVEELASMEAHGISRGLWGGAPGPFYCGPKEEFGSTGFWDSVVGRERDVTATPNDNGRTDVEGCCWWGRGSLSVKGTCLYGKLNFHLGKHKADREGPEKAMFPGVDFCRDPGQICTGPDSVPLRWITGMYSWMETVQKYSKDGFNYQEELVRYVNENLVNEEFFKGATSIHVLGCHEEMCDWRTVTDFADRLRAFEKVLAMMGLQFGSHAEPEAPFKAFPGQQQPTPPPTVAAEEELSALTDSPTMAPVQATERAIVPVNVFLTGVPDGKNMTNDELQVFEGLMYDLLVPRLATVDVNVVDVITDAQIPNPDVLPESDATFDTQVSDGEELPVLQLVMNVTVAYNPPPPEGMRDWSLYLKTWIESFGNTMVEIFTSPKHVQHPQTTSKFWDDLTDISASNVHPPNTEPTAAPSPWPTQIIYPPDNSKYIYAGVGTAVGLLICCFCVAFCYKLRQFRQLQSAPQPREKQIRFEDEEAWVPPQDRAFALDTGPLDKVTEEASLESEDRDSSEDDSSSSSDDSSSSDSSSSNSSEEEPEYTNGDTPAKSRSLYSDTTGDEDDSTYDDTAKSKSFASSTIDEEDEESEDAPALHARFEDGGSVDEPNPADVARDKEMKQFDDIVERVQSNDPTLKQVVLDERKQLIGHDFGAESLWNALVDNTYVERLSLRSCNMTDEEVASLSLALVDNTTVTHVWLGDNDITSEGVEYLIATLESNQTIVYMELAGNDGIDPGLEDDVRSMLEPRESLYNKTPAVDKVAQLMQRVSDNDPTLPSLDLSGMDIGTRDDAMSMFDALAGNEFVRKLDLSSNGIDDDCASSLSLVLLENKAITHLNLANNAIYSEGAEYILGTLDTNTTIVELDLSGNFVDHSLLQEIEAILNERNEPTSTAMPEPDGNPLLASALRRLRDNDPMVTELKLEGVDLANSSETDDFIDALAVNTSVTTVNLDNTGIDDTLIATLSLALADNQAIKSLSLKGNDITSEGAEYLLGTLDTNTSLVELDLRGNFVDGHLLAEIADILSSRQSQGGPSTDADLSKPPMHEVPEESDAELAKRKAIMAITRDPSIPWPEKNKRIMDIQQHYYVPKDREPQQEQAAGAADGSVNSVQVLVERVLDNDRKLVEINMDGHGLSLEDQTALFEALGQNSRVTSLSLANCRIGNEGAAELVNALRKNTTLLQVNLEDNQITSNAALNVITVLKEENDTLQRLELKDNRVRLGLLSQIEKLLERRRAGFKEPEQVMAATVLPVVGEVNLATLDESTSSGRKSSGSRSKRSGQSGKSKSSKSRGDRQRRRERNAPAAL